MSVMSGATAGPSVVSRPLLRCVVLCALAAMVLTAPTDVQAGKSVANGPQHLTSGNLARLAPALAASIAQLPAKARKEALAALDQRHVTTEDIVDVSPDGVLLITDPPLQPTADEEAAVEAGLLEQRRRRQLVSDERAQAYSKSGECELGRQSARKLVVGVGLGCHRVLGIWWGLERDYNGRPPISGQA